MDVLAHFGLQCDPFGFQPDSRFFYESAMHLEALRGLRFAAHAAVPCTVLLGPTGSGKTLLASLLRKDAHPRRRVAWADGLQVGTADFSVQSSGPGQPGSATAPSTAHNPADSGQLCPLLILDNADELGPQQLRRLAVRLEPGSPSPLNLVLIGTSTLTTTLQDSVLQRLRQRVVRAFTLAHLTRSESSGYFAHRWHAAGGVGEPFDAECLLRIHLLCEGLPGRMNRLAGNALVIAANAGDKTIGLRHIEAARGWQLSAATKQVTTTPAAVLGRGVPEELDLAGDTSLQTSTASSTDLVELEQKLTRALAAVRAARARATAGASRANTTDSPTPPRRPVVLGVAPRTDGAAVDRTDLPTRAAAAPQP